LVSSVGVKGGRAFPLIHRRRPDASRERKGARIVRNDGADDGVNRLTKPDPPPPALDASNPEGSNRPGVP
jgi:hypothetical protein